MTQPRRRLGGQVAHIARETREDRFYLRPDAQGFILNLLGFFMAYAQARTEMRVHGAMASLNRLDYVVTDPFILRSSFMRDVHSFFARALSRTLRLGHSIWSERRPADCVCADAETELDKLIEIWTRPVKAGLVRRAKDWPGFKLLPSDWGQTLTFHQPDVSDFFTEDTRFEASYELHVTPPPALQHLPVHEAVALAEAKLRDAEDAIWKARQKQAHQAAEAAAEEAGTSCDAPRETIEPEVWEIDALYAIDPNEAPPRDKDTMPPPRPQPCFAAKDEATVRYLAKELKQFYADHRRARKKLQKGQRPLFPAGTVARYLIDHFDMAPASPEEPNLHRAAPGVWPRALKGRKRNHLYTPPSRKAR